MTALAIQIAALHCGALDTPPEHLNVVGLDLSGLQFRVSAVREIVAAWEDDRPCFEGRFLRFTRSGLLETFPQLAGKTIRVYWPSGPMGCRPHRVDLSFGEYAVPGEINMFIGGSFSSEEKAREAFAWMWENGTGTFEIIGR